MVSTQLASSQVAQVFTGTATVGLALIGLSYVLLVVAALVSVLRSRLDGGMKAVWVLLVWLAPFVGSIAWFLVGRRSAAPHRHAL
ncbi:PLD nuclease N-terminal domain-containing protein [Solihabitans fulvus]|uniref:PLD nuclease N-terminal domain-containing protein n=1 Tax=Solihabitans fulvus TaxID=1892852 RepID=UPI001CB767F7|nr:PLD nuclease N-terminal domain-containing protein [Solihabitans fulvus]